MARNTRLATTVTARYIPSVGAVDAFYLDGRISGQREEQFADITLDREDRGAFFAVYASSRGSRSDAHNEDGNRQFLDQISNDLKRNSRRNIDYEINELAECVVNVSGRLTLADAAIRQPYFSGIIVKDGEMAAITLGRGSAYLYRDDALYPLTQDEYPMEAIDGNGRKVANMKDFAAGIAGTIRYSNIAQLKQDDCIIMCNKEVMEAIGQRQMLRLLDQAEDQCEAAGMVMDIAARENPNVSMQFMIGFVEDIVNVDRLGRGTLARGFTSRVTDRTGNKNMAAPFSGFDDPIHTPQTAAPIASTTGAAATAAESGKDRFEDPFSAANDGESAGTEGRDHTVDGQASDDFFAESDKTEVSESSFAGDQASYENPEYDDSIFYNFANQNIGHQGFLDEEGPAAQDSAHYDDFSTTDEIDYNGFGQIQQATAFNQDNSTDFYVNPSTESYGASDLDANADAYDEQVYADSYTDDDRYKKIAVAALAVVAVVLLFFIVKTLATGGSESSTTTPSFNAGVPGNSSEEESSSSSSLLGIGSDLDPSDSDQDASSSGSTLETSESASSESSSTEESTTLATTTEATTTAPTTEATTTAAPTTTAPTTEATTTAAPTTEATTTVAPTPEPTVSTFPSSYTVQEGDSLFTIAESLYGDASYMNAIAQLNNLSIVDGVAIVQAGDVLDLPQP